MPTVRPDQPIVPFIFLRETTRTTMPSVWTQLLPDQASSVTVGSRNDSRMCRYPRPTEPKVEGTGSWKTEQTSESQSSKTPRQRLKHDKRVNQNAAEKPRERVTLPAWLKVSPVIWKRAAESSHHNSTALLLLIRPSAVLPAPGWQPRKRPDRRPHDRCRTAFAFNPIACLNAR